MVTELQLTRLPVCCCGYRGDPLQVHQVHCRCFLVLCCFPGLLMGGLDQPEALQAPEFGVRIKES